MTSSFPPLKYATNFSSPQTLSWWLETGYEVPINAVSEDTLWLMIQSSGCCSSLSMRSSDVQWRLITQTLLCSSLGKWYNVRNKCKLPSSASGQFSDFLFRSSINHEIVHLIRNVGDILEQRRSYYRSSRTAPVVQHVHIFDSLRTPCRTWRFSLACHAVDRTILLEGNCDDASALRILELSLIIETMLDIQVRPHRVGIDVHAHVNCTLWQPRSASIARTTRKTVCT